MLDRLPFELLDQILQLVCTDSDDTNNFELLRVSKHIARIAERHVYHHLAFSWNEFGVKAFAQVAKSGRAPLVRSLGFWHALDRPRWSESMPAYVQGVDLCPYDQLLLLFFDSIPSFSITRLVIGGKPRADGAYVDGNPHMIALIAAFLNTWTQPMMKELRLVNVELPISRQLRKSEQLMPRLGRKRSVNLATMTEVLLNVEKLVVTCQDAAYFAEHGLHLLRIFANMKDLEIYQTAEQHLDHPELYQIPYHSVARHRDCYETRWESQLPEGCNRLRSLIFSGCNFTFHPICGTVEPSLPTVRRVVLHEVKVYRSCEGEGWAQVLSVMARSSVLSELELSDLGYATRAYPPLRDGNFDMRERLPSPTSQSGSKIPGLLTTTTAGDIDALARLISTVNENRHRQGLPEYHYNPNYKESALVDGRRNALCNRTHCKTELEQPTSQMCGLAGIVSELASHTEALDALDEMDRGPPAQRSCFPRVTQTIPAGVASCSRPAPRSWRGLPQTP